VAAGWTLRFDRLRALGIEFDGIHVRWTMPASLPTTQYNAAVTDVADLDSDAAEEQASPKSDSASSSAFATAVQAAQQRLQRT
jgi:hypothetical protein